MSNLNLIKLSVGSTDVDSMSEWQATARAQGADGLPRHVTRMWPKRADEILRGGSIYWVIKGVILCRQMILRFDGVDRGDGINRCGIVLDPEIIRVAATPKRAFQGWRYLLAADAPRDLRGGSRQQEALPPQLESALAEIGVL